MITFSHHLLDDLHAGRDSWRVVLVIAAAAFTLAFLGRMLLH
jgi:hypothetical protein